MNEDKVILSDGKTRREIFSFGKKEDAYKFWIAILNKNIPVHIEMLVYPVMVDFFDDDEVADMLQQLFEQYYRLGVDIDD